MSRLGAAGGAAAPPLESFLEEQGVVEKAGEEAAGERTDPVNAMILPVGGGERGTERAGGIESPAGKRSNDDYPNTILKPMANPATAREGEERSSTAVAKNVEDEKKGSDAFEEHAVQAREIVREHGRAESDGVPGVLRDDGFEEKRGGGGSRELGDPIGNRVERVQALGDPEADGDGGVEMASGDMAEGRNHNGHGQAMG